jgi:hypothetical protein
MRRLAAAAVTCLVLAGCGGGAPVSADAFTERAEEVIAAWNASATESAWRTGFVPLAELTFVDQSVKSIYRTDDVDLQDNAKRALMGGVYRLAPDALKDAPAVDGEQEITFADASTMSVPLMNAADAFAQVQTIEDPADCSGEGCVLTVTGVRLGTMPLATSRGGATVPAWQFTIAELTVPVMYVAVVPSAITPLPEPAVEPDQGLTTVDAVTADGIAASRATQLTVHYGTGACLESHAALLYETSNVVVVGADAVESSGACTSQLVHRMSAVELSGPLGDRVLLDAATGKPIVFGTCGQWRFDC